MVKHRPQAPGTSTQGGRSRTRHVVVLVGAAALSFVAALWAQGRLRDPQAGTDELVQPVVRERTDARAPDQAAPAPMPTPAAPSNHASAMASRMDEQVVQDPFAPLNSYAGSKTLSEVPVAPTAPKRPLPLSPEPIALVASPAPPPAAPVAPPLPFSGLGAMQSPGVASGSAVAFLKLGEDILIVRAGDQISDQYKVESVSPERVVLTYLPLKQQQILNLRP